MKNSNKALGLAASVLEFTSVIVLCFAGLLGVVVSLLDLAGKDLANGPLGWVKGMAPLTLLIVALLALGLGLEQFIRRRVAANEIRRLRESLEAGIGGQVLENYDELYDMATYLVKRAEEHIRATSIGEIASKSPTEYRKAIAGHLKKSMKWRKPVRADIVAGTAIRNDPQSIHAKVTSRLEIYGKHGVLDLVNVYVLDLPWGLDFLIIDKQHLLIALPTVRGVKQFTTGTVFINQPRIAREFALWFDEFLLKESMPYVEFCEVHPNSVRG